MRDHSIFRVGDVVHMKYHGHLLTGAIFYYDAGLTKCARVAFPDPYRVGDTIIKRFTNDGRAYEGGEVVLFR